MSKTKPSHEPVGGTATMTLEERKSLGLMDLQPTPLAAVPRSKQPAYPETVVHTENQPATLTSGMLLRDFFAAHVIQGLVTREDYLPAMCKEAYDIADALILQRELP